MTDEGERMRTTTEQASEDHIWVSVLGLDEDGRPTTTETTLDEYLAGVD